MLAKIKSCGLKGIDGFIINVETDISNGIPAFDLVGLGDIAVREAKERVRSAIRNTGYEFPARRITVNLAPANLRKEGSALDLPIALGILAATGQVNSSMMDDYMFIGELSLDGQIKGINGILSMVLCASQEGIKNIILPKENADEAAVIETVNIYPAEHLEDVILHINGYVSINRHIIDVKSLFDAKEQVYENDFSEVCGQENVKRVLEIAAAGSHSCLIMGTPGAGKTMLARRLPSILPPLTFDEALQVTRIHSIAGILPPKTSLITTRPFRSPHHTISATSLIGGGKHPKPGEISLAHYGVLFLDEVFEFDKYTLEAMRQPLEDGVVTISRLSGSITYPAEIMLILTGNPCPCGYRTDDTKKCTCSYNEIHNYLNKLSGPLLDRIDLCVEAMPVRYKELDSIGSGEKSSQIRERVIHAKDIQLKRYKGYKIFSNSQLSGALIKKFCKLDPEGNELLKSAFEQLNLSARAYNRILKVARTIADLEGSTDIKSVHIAEAIQYRVTSFR